MLMIAGLIGLFVSGVMVAFPLPLTTDDVDDSDPVEGTETDQTPASADASSPLLEALAPPQTDEDAGQTEELEILDDIMPESGPDEEDSAGPNETAPARDAIGGSHATDAIEGSWAAPITETGDAMLGGGGDDAIQGGNDEDLIFGDDGGDTLSGGDGRDHLSGGSGDDSLIGDLSDDELHGDAGDDMLEGGDGDDLLSGYDGDDVLIGGDGDDRLFGGEGNDALLGGAGNDILDGTVLRDENGLDRDAGDRLAGGAGDDTLAGGASDTLNGGAGKDSFLFRAPSAAAFEMGHDAPLIEDFDLDEDQIEITYAGNDTPQVSFMTDAGSTIVLVDDFVIARVSGVEALSADHIAFIRVV